MIDTVAKSRSIRACRFGGRAGAHEVARDKLPRRAARFGRVAALALAAAALAPSAGLAQNQNGARAAGVTVQTGAGVHAGEFVVPVNKSQILRLDVPFTDISVGNAKIADVLALTNRTLYILGKAIGTTSLTIFGPNRRLIAVADLVVTFDIEGVKARLNEMMPGETVEVRPLGNSVVLSGMVSSAERAERAATIANRYAPGAVTNMLRVGSAQQVMLAVRFAEVRRSALKSIGINLLALKDGITFGTIGDTGFEFGTGAGASGVDPDPGFLRGVLGISIGSYTVQALFDALETKGFSRTLAEPTLVALSGDTASFLAGGEFPITVISEDGQVDVTFKQFGISLDFTPTVLDRNRINLIVKPEVSNLDFDTTDS
ncbi:MAG TPA: pilus assembly protein N-terminal domain-containing protein, partial [Alphaproteobacteria bacterium]